MKVNLTQLFMWALVFVWVIIAIITLFGCTATRPTPAGEYKVIKIVAKDKDGNVATKYIGQIK